MTLRITIYSVIFGIVFSLSAFFFAIHNQILWITIVSFACYAGLIGILFRQFRPNTKGVPRLKEVPLPPLENNTASAPILDEETLTRIDRMMSQITIKIGILVVSPEDYEAFYRRGTTKHKWADLHISPALKPGQFNLLLPKDHINMRVR